MIIDKFFNNKNNTFIVTSQIITLFKAKNEIEIDTIFNELILINSNIDQEIFLESIALLYLTGKIDYNILTNSLVVKK